jgi:hypothetical protein
MAEPAEARLLSLPKQGSRYVVMDENPDTTQTPQP